MLQTFKASLRHIKKEYLFPIDPDNSKFIIALKSAVIGLIALISGHFLQLPQAIFLFLSAVLFMIVAPTEPSKNNFIKMIYCGVLAAIGCFLITVVSHSIYQLSLGIFVFAFVAIYLNRFLVIRGFAGYIALIIVVIAAGIEGDTAVGILRAGNVLIGLVLALIFTFIIFPYQTAKNVRIRLGIAQEKMAEFFYGVITDGLRGNQLVMLHQQQKNDLIQFMVDNDTLVKVMAAKNIKYQSLKDLADSEKDLFEILIGLSNIFTSPITFSAAANFFPEMENFYLKVYQFYKALSAYILQDRVDVPYYQEFATIVDKTIAELQSNLIKVIAEPNFYHWPFDLANCIDLLGFMKVRTLALLQKAEQL